MRFRGGECNPFNFYPKRTLSKHYFKNVYCPFKCELAQRVRARCKAERMCKQQGENACNVSNADLFD